MKDARAYQITFVNNEVITFHGYVQSVSDNANWYLTVADEHLKINNAHVTYLKESKIEDFEE